MEQQTENEAKALQSTEAVPAENGTVKSGTNKKRRVLCILKSVVCGLMLLMFIFSLSLPTIQYRIKDSYDLKNPDAYSFGTNAISVISGAQSSGKNAPLEVDSFKANRGTLSLKDPEGLPQGAEHEATREQVEKDAAFKRTLKLSGFEKRQYMEHFVITFDDNNTNYIAYLESETNKSINEIKSSINQLPAGLGDQLQQTIALLQKQLEIEKSLLRSYHYSIEELILDTFPADVLGGNHAGLRTFVTEAILNVTEGSEAETVTVPEEWFNEASGKLLIGTYDKAAIDAFVQESIKIIKDTVVTIQDVEGEQTVDELTRIGCFSAAVTLMPRYEQVFAESGEVVSRDLEVQSEGGIYAFCVIQLFTNGLLFLLLIPAAIGVLRVWLGKRMRKSSYLLGVIIETLFVCIAFVGASGAKILRTVFGAATVVCLIVGIACIVTEIIYDKMLSNFRREEAAENAKPAETPEDSGETPAV